MHTLQLPQISLASVDRHPRPNDRKDAIEWARKLLKRNDWVILDTETTGISETSEVIQVGILSCRGEVLIDSYVRPTTATAIPAEAAAVHGITMQRLQYAPTMAQLLPRLRKELKGKLVIMYNADFDTRLLGQSTPAYCEKLALQTECAMKPYSAFVGDWRKSKNDYKWQKLPGAAHGAIEDCQATLALIKQMAVAKPPQAGVVQTIINILLALLIVAVIASLLLILFSRYLTLS